MSMQDFLPTTAELIRLTHIASQARDLSTLVCAEHQMRMAIRRALVSEMWSDLDTVKHELSASPSLAARFNECLHHALETPELAARGPGAHWHGLVLAIPVTVSSRSGMLVSLPQTLTVAVRESLQARFPSGTGVRVLGRLIPQLVAHSMGTRSLYELVEELASGGHAGGGSDLRLQHDFVPHARSLGRHYLFALAFAAASGRLAFEMPKELRHEPGLGKWAAAQTDEAIADFAERGWALVMRVFPPQRLCEMLSLLPVFGDVREVDGLLEHVASHHGVPIDTQRADLSLGYGEERGLRIAISDRRVGISLARGLYRLAALGPEAGAYRVAVRLASAGVEIAATEDNLNQAVKRAIELTRPAQATEAGKTDEVADGRPLGTRTFWSRLSRAPRHGSADTK